MSDDLKDAVPVRRVDGPLLPGAKITAKPKGSMKEVARYIVEQTGNARDLVDWALAVWKDTEAPMKHRIWAFEWLSDRCLGTRINAQAMQIVVNVKQAGMNLRTLTDDQLAQVTALFETSTEIH